MCGRSRRAPTWWTRRRRQESWCAAHSRLDGACVSSDCCMQESKRAEVLQEQEEKRLASAPPRGQGDQVPSPLRPAPRGTHSGWCCAVPQSDLMFQRESAKGMGEDEEKFDDSIDVNQTYSWHDKYRPRKPRYFNRVHTGCAAADCAPLARAALSAQRGVAVSAATTGTSTTRRTTTTTTPRRRSCRGTSSTCAASCRVAGGARASHRPPLRADILPGPH